MIIWRVFREKIVGRLRESYFRFGIFLEIPFIAWLCEFFVCSIFRLKVIETFKFPGKKVVFQKFCGFPLIHRYPFGFNSDFGVWSCRPWLGWWIESANNRLESVSLYRSITICCVAMPTGVVRDRILRPLHTRHPSTNIHRKKTCFFLNFKPKKFFPWFYFDGEKFRVKLSDGTAGHTEDVSFGWTPIGRGASLIYPPPLHLCVRCMTLPQLFMSHSLPNASRGKRVNGVRCSKLGSIVLNFSLQLEWNRIAHKFMSGFNV